LLIIIKAILGPLISFLEERDLPQILSLPLGGGGLRWGRVLFFSSPFLWEGED